MDGIICDGATATETLTTMNIGKHLCKKYPGHFWKVQVDKGMVSIFNMLLNGKYGFEIPESKVDNDYKVITQAAGEILERYGLTRGALRIDEIRALKRKFNGEIIHDTSK